ncbi:pimeloyl-ACP methyl ester carboxylesterase [Catalinimonas alkaloidigena]|uniref:alpha/beta fold hydrolase n=1 Tax=Catalinimonas alkaloidigena TaxID=1075417 RepID=UPI0024068949|nr:alpha/beta hydrolase [Catalinimonas alkaloidigena]MDF9797591.1 pimeloyl-ACP methyl ester carboxylesterase [Catalinimonas alkaloidigena]
MIRKLLFLLLFFLPFLSLHAQDVKPLGIALENYDYPFPVNYIQLELQDESLKMAYMDVQAEEANGKTVMLMHGKNFCGAYWRQAAQDLSEAGFRVIIPDQIGFGKSSKPVDLQYTFHLLAQNTKKLLDSLGIENISVLGHSMGGMVATRFVLMYPEMVDKLILENPIGLEDWKVKVPYHAVDYWYEQELKKNYESIKKYQLESYYDGKWDPAYDQWVNILAGWTLSPMYPQVAWNAALTYDMIFTQPVVYEFEHVQAPTLLIIGQRDRTALGKNWVSEEVRETLGDYPALGKATAEKIPDAELVELDNVGHLPHIEAYERFIAPLLSFLKD